MYAFFSKMELQFLGNLDLLIYPYFNNYYCYCRLTVLPGVITAEYCVRKSEKQETGMCESTWTNCLISTMTCKCKLCKQSLHFVTSYRKYI